jgi:hypothetical protein
MLEKDIEEPINYSSSNFAKDNVQSSNKDIKLESDSNFMMVIRFPNKKSFSLEIPKIWNTKKLLSFIMYTFKSEFNNSKLVFILKGNSLSPQSETPLKEILNSDKINYMTISLKSNIQENQNNHEINNLSLKTNKEVFNSDEFMEMEKSAIDDYIKIFKKNSVNTFPLMNPAYNHRREQISINSELEKLAAFEPVPLEDFPRGKYFQLKIIFKCFISFFAFGIYIKGFNFILFLWVLIGYYWYCVNNVIDEFYNKKIQEIGITEEEYKRIKNEGINEYKGLGQGKELFIINDENEDNEAKNKGDDEQKKVGDKKGNNISDNNINKTINELKNDIEEDLKDKEDDKKETNKINSFVLNKEDDKNIEDNKRENENNINEATPLLNNINDILTGNNLRGRNNNNRINNGNIGENNRINNINNDIFGQNNSEDNRDNKNENENQEANRPESAIEIIYQIISVFFLSFIPVWCDEFEANNPISVNNNHHDDENNNENNDNNINNANNNENNINNDNNNIINNEDNTINNINNDFINEINDNNNRPTSVEENDSNNNKMTSSRVVNMSDDSSRDTRVYKLIKKENQSANENEYVFSENGGIDNLSMNSELYKQKKEKEKEKDKEKEKQIFEEDEEYIIEEDKKNK